MTVYSRMGEAPLGGVEFKKNEHRYGNHFH
jgi:hypothetical protein